MLQSLLPPTVRRPMLMRGPRLLSPGCSEAPAAVCWVLKRARRLHTSSAATPNTPAATAAAAYRLRHRRGRLPAAASIPAPAGRGYFVHQKEAVAAFLSHSNTRGLLLADEMGLGKTVSVLGEKKEDEIWRRYGGDQEEIRRRLG